MFKILLLLFLLLSVGICCCWWCCCCCFGKKMNFFFYLRYRPQKASILRNQSILFSPLTCDKNIHIHPSFIYGLWHTYHTIKCDINYHEILYTIKISSNYPIQTCMIFKFFFILHIIFFSIRSLCERRYISL